MAVVAGAQTRIDLRTQIKSGSVDFSWADSTRPSKIGTLLPAYCQVGETFLKTDGVAGQNWYVCLAGNVWALQGTALPGVNGKSGAILSTDGSGLFWKTLGGDISGSPAGVTVNGILGRPLSSLAPVTGQALTWNGTQWAPASLAVTSIFGRSGAITAQTGDYTFPQIGGTVATSQLPAAGGDLSGTLASATVGRLQGLSVAASAPTVGQVLTWTGTQWTPQSASAVTSIFGRSGTVAAQNGDYSFSQIAGSVAAAQLPAAGGDVSGTLTAASVIRLQGWSVSSAAPQSGQHLTWNGTQWAPANAAVATVFGRSGAVTPQSGDYSFNQIAGSVAASQLPVAGGDLSGTLTAAIVSRLQGNAVSATAPQSGQHLAWNGSQWAPANAPVATVFGRSGTVTAQNGDYSFSQVSGTVAASQLPAAGGDLSGTLTAATVAKLQGYPLGSTAPTPGQVLAWTGLQWLPQAPSSAVPSVFGRTGAVTAQSGDYSFNQISGTVAASQMPAAGGDLSGSLPAATVTRLQGWGVASAAPSTGQVLTWSGTQWTPQNASSSAINFAGDLSGTPSVATVRALQGQPVAAAPPSTGQVLAWSGTQWSPQNPTGGVASVFGRTGSITAHSGDYTAAQVTNAVDLTAPNTYTAGARQTFQGTAAAAAIRLVPSPLPATPLGGDVAVDSGDSNRVKLYDGGAWVTLTPSPAPANYSATFTSQTAVSVPGATHQLGTANLVVECYDGATPSSAVEPNSVTVNPVTYDVNVGFAAAQSGHCIIAGYNGGNGGGSGGGSGGAVTSVFGRTGNVVATSGDYSFSQISGTIGDAQVAAGVNAAKIGAGTVGNQAFGYLANVTGDVQSQLNAKLSSSAAAGGDVTGTLSNLTVQKLQSRTVAASAPADGQALVWSAAMNQWQPGSVSGGGSGGGATMASQLGDFWVSLQSATVLAIGTGCSTATPCNQRIGNQVYSITSPASATLVAGSGMAYVYLDSNGVLTVGHSMTVSCTGCTAVSGVSTFPPDAIPLFTWSASNGAWITGGGTDLRGWLSTSSIQAGSGIVLVQAGGRTTVAVDTAVVPAYLAASATLAFPQIASGTCSADVTFLLAGANPGDTVIPGWPASLPGGLTGTMRVSAAGTIAVRLCALGVTVTPPSATFQAAIVQSN